MRFSFAILLIALAAAGCTTRSGSRAQAQIAFLAGQNQALQQQLAAQFRGVTVIGAVQNPQVPWVAGLTLAQAVATANYLDSKEPKQIIITRQGDSATLDAKVLFSGPDIPVEAGDVVELSREPAPKSTMGFSSVFLPVLPKTILTNILGWTAFVQPPCKNGVVIKTKL